MLRADTSSMEACDLGRRGRCVHCSAGSNRIDHDCWSMAFATSAQMIVEDIRLGSAIPQLCARTRSCNRTNSDARIQCLRNGPYVAKRPI